MKSRSSITNEYVVPLQYSFVFTSKPFGVSFRNRDPENALTKTDVFVDQVDEKSAAYNHVIVGSKLIQIQNETVEGLSPSDIISRITTKYGDTLPLLMTFKKPLTRRLSFIKNNAIKTSTDIACTPRAIFLDIRAFYQSWRNLASDILLNALLICTDKDYKNILKTNKTYNDMRSDAVFKNLLQWKNEQGLVLIVNSKKNKAMFWRSFSKKLVSLRDPSTYNTAKYNPLRLDVAEYKKLGSFKYNVTLKDIANELAAGAMNVEVIKEILYRSNVWLHIYDENGAIINEKDIQTSPSSTFEDDFDELLDEVTTVWDENTDTIYIE